MIENSTDVLIAGAGPTGLVLAIVLAKLGVRVRIVDKTSEPGTTSRALAVQARTLELYRTIDLADEVLSRGLVLGAVNLWRGGSRAARIELGEIGHGLSPYPFGIIFPQDEHERLLIEHLAGLGVLVERETELASVEIAGGGVSATLRKRDGTIETTGAAYLAGCDGARSTARAAIHASYPGGTYQHLFYVADIEGRGAAMNKELHVILDEAGFLGLFPLAGDGRARLIGTIKEDAAARGDELGWDDVDRTVLDRIGLDVAQVNWFSTYRVHHRVAGTFRRGPVFLLGDAAHIHSPVGGQGMNTGIGDAMNLGWKLAAVLARRANQDLCDTYEPERIAFARRLVATTDRIFQAATSESELASVVRTGIAPRLVSRVAQSGLGRRLFFRALSQIGIAYRRSAWSDGRAGSVHAGDRLPWVMPARDDLPDNFAPLRSLDWQAHVYGRPPAEVAARCDQRGLALHVFPFDEATRRAALRDDQLYLVRPDGYLAMVAPLDRATERLDAYLDAHGVRSR
jgi:2-polyprenyl-6-methoxyphenol hydroxylase-like FAD-dependent oxidoreductase